MSDTDVITHSIDRVPAAMVTSIWPGVVHLVEKGAARWPQDRSADDYLAACRCADAQLWLVAREGKLRGVFISSVINWPQHRVCVLELLGGEGFDDWAADLDEAVTAWALEWKCDRLRIGGRKGLTKQAERRGYRLCAVLLEKELAHVGR